MKMIVGDKTKHEYNVKYTEDPLELEAALTAASPQWITYDVETTGLHLKKDRPFLAVLCWKGEAWVFPTTPDFLHRLPLWAKKVRRLFAHNATYEMHMTANVIGDKRVLEIKNWGDTMGCCRLTFESISKGDGGDSLKLKDIGTKYIERGINRYEKAVKDSLKAINAQRRKILIAMLKGQHKYTMKRFEEEVNAGICPAEVYNTYHEWTEAYPEANYSDVPMDIMLPYVAVDGILTDIIVQMSLPVIKYKEQDEILKMEFKLLRTVFKTERQGLPVDREYLQESSHKLEEYIADLTIQMHELAGREFNVGQHALIKDIYEERNGVRPESTDKFFMRKEIANGDELARVISKLRTLEKWKSTYIDRILEASEYDGRLYTTLGQFNPVSGRFSGDAQQFPKNELLTIEGDRLRKEGKDVPPEHVLYHPRRAFVGTAFYLDYSQVELRVQSHYTLLFGGDLNLCRAYMPFKCTHFRTGETYAYGTMEDRGRWIELREGAPTDKHWEDLLKDGWSVWQTEDGKPWIPTDVHSATSHKALVIMGKDPKEMPKGQLKYWRNIGKTFNFMRNYGGGPKKAAEVLDIDIESATAMNNGYSEAFPMVVVYQNVVVKSAMQKGYVQSPSGRRYYLSDPNKFYKFANYLIQGWCADMLKKKLLEIDEYIENNCADLLAMQLYVHDEIQFAALGSKEECMPHIMKIKEIMEDLPEVNVPIVAEVEYTHTTWDAKGAA